MVKVPDRLPSGVQTVPQLGDGGGRGRGGEVCNSKLAKITGHYWLIMSATRSRYTAKDLRFLLLSATSCGRSRTSAYCRILSNTIEQLERRYGRARQD